MPALPEEALAPPRHPPPPPRRHRNTVTGAGYLLTLDGVTGANTFCRYYGFQQAGNFKQWTLANLAPFTQALNTRTGEVCKTGACYVYRGIECLNVGQVMCTADVNGNVREPGERA